MEIQKIFSDLSGEERLYSVLMNEDEMYLFSELQKEFGRYKRENKRYRQRYLRSYSPDHIISEEALNDALLADKLDYAELDKSTRKKIKGQLEAASEGEGYKSVMKDARTRSDRVHNIREQNNNIIDPLAEKQDAWKKTHERYRGTPDTGGRGGVRKTLANDYVSELNRKRLLEAKNNGTLEAGKARNQRARENYQKLRESTLRSETIPGQQTVNGATGGVNTSQPKPEPKPQNPKPQAPASEKIPGTQSAKGAAQSASKGASKGMMENFRTWKAANPKAWKGTKIGGGIAAGVGAIGTGAYLYNKNKKKKQNNQ